MHRPSPLIDLVLQTRWQNDSPSHTIERFVQNQGNYFFLSCDFSKNITAVSLFLFRCPFFLPRTLSWLLSFSLYHLNLYRFCHGLELTSCRFCICQAILQMSMQAVSVSFRFCSNVFRTVSSAIPRTYYSILSLRSSVFTSFDSVALETVDHTVAGCSALALMDYTDRHNQVASIIHWDVWRRIGIPVESRWYRHLPDRLVETDDITMMWDTTIPTDKKIKANRPDICLTNKKTNTCLLIDISCPVDGNIGKKLAETLVKYSDLQVEISRMWHCRTLVVPVVLGALGTVHSGIARWLDIIPGHHNLQPLQKTVLLGSTRILRKVMSSF